MSIDIVRIAERWYVEKSARTGTLIDTPAATTAELLADREAIDLAVVGEESDLPGGVRQAPVTAPCRVVAQMTNFVSHIKDSGFDPETVLMASVTLVDPPAPGATTTVTVERLDETG